ncbi:MAG: hypothetical protein ACREOF_12925 [Gemmatimonadales bacterium]
MREQRDPEIVTVEAPLEWAWLHDRLSAAGFTVRVAHPQQVAQLLRAKGRPKATMAAARDEAGRCPMQTMASSA